MRALEGHAKEVRGVAFLPDGRLVSVGADKTARLWQPDGTGTVIHKAKGPLYALDVSPDGRMIAFSGRHNLPGTPVTLYDTAAGEVRRTMTWTAEDIVWDHGSSELPTGQVLPVARAIWSLSFSADGRTLAVAGRKPEGGKIPNGGGGLTWALCGDGEGISLPDRDAYAVRYSPADTLLAVTARNQVRFYIDSQPTADLVQPPLPWDEDVIELISSDSIQTSAAFTYPVQCEWAPAIAFLPSDGRCVIAAGSFVHLVDPTGNRKPVKVKSQSRVVTALAPTPDGRGLLVGGKPGRVEVFDLGDSTPIRRTAFDFDVGGVYGLAVAPDGLTFAVAGDKGLLVCDTEAG